jgi:hypothetical protein
MPHGEAPPSGQPVAEGGGQPDGHLVERCAALDVHKDTLVACGRLLSPDGGRLQELRAFKATTAGCWGRRAAGVGGLAVGEPAEPSRTSPAVAAATRTPTVHPRDPGPVALQVSRVRGDAVADRRRASGLKMANFPIQRTPNADSAEAITTIVAVWWEAAARRARVLPKSAAQVENARPRKASAQKGTTSLQSRDVQRLPHAQVRFRW